MKPDTRALLLRVIRVVCVVLHAIERLCPFDRSENGRTDDSLTTSLTGNFFVNKILLKNFFSVDVLHARGLRIVSCERCVSVTVKYKTLPKRIMRNCNENYLIFTDEQYTEECMNHLKTEQRRQEGYKTNIPARRTNSYSAEPN